MKDVGRYTHLAPRKGTANWQFRARVPLDLVAHFGKREITKSLGTADRAEAKRRVRDEAEAFDKQCRALRNRAASDGRDKVGSVALTSLSEAAIEQMAIDLFGILAADGEQRHRMAVPLDWDEALINLERGEAALNDPNDLEAVMDLSAGRLR